jgi:putative endopeptidase
MEEYFNGIEVAPGTFANGAFTLGENIADHGGLQVAYLAFQNAKKQRETNNVSKANQKRETINASETSQERELQFTEEQRFFLAYSNVWAGNIRDEEILQRTKNDPHSLGRWRVNGALPHINAWYEAWNVTPESPMYLAPEKRVSIW